MAKHRKQSQVGKNVRRALATTTVAAASTAGLSTLANAPEASATDWSGIIACESGGNPTIVNNTPAGVRAGRPAGLFQIVTGTWLAYGGGKYAPTADQATVAQQYAVAEAIHAAQGFSPWECSPGHSSVVIQAPAPRHAAPPAPAPAPVVHSAPAHLPGSGKYYVVKSGDSLYRIAAQQEGNGNLWPTLYASNKGTVGSNPNMIFPGQQLSL